jgi:GMP synthase (glutamine-hydrolysing)
MNHISIIVLDFGSQYTQIIARKLREKGFYSQILPFNETIENIELKKPKGIILSGGPSSVYDENAPKIDKKIYNLGIPILGICYGMQLIASFFGASVIKSSHKEYGKANLSIINKDLDIFKDIDDNKIVWMSHSDKIETLPNGFEKIAYSQNSPYAAIYNKNKNIYAFQFHPEVYHSQQGDILLNNFASYICKCEASWSMDSFAKEQIEKIKKQIGNKKVLCAVSGGVDSSVVAALLSKAIGDNLICVFVDNGLLRQNESQEVQGIFKSRNIPLITIDASENFLNKLKNITDPEQKRKIIGETFIEVFDKEAKKHNSIQFLAQGTLYTDVIESVSTNGPSKTIKSHHNVGGLPSWMKFDLIEPLKKLFKDEVRLLGLELGLPKSMIQRHPFPGPGLAIRIMGDVNEYALNLVRLSDTILIDVLKTTQYYDKTWQAFTVLLNVSSVGVMGDNRTYDNTICIRIVDATDGMTATFSYIPHDILETISRRIINEIEGINRVVYDISSKPPSTIEWE